MNDTNFNYDIIKLFEQIVDEVKKSYDEVESEIINPVVKGIDSRKIKSPKGKKSKKSNILNRKSNEEEEDNVDIPKDLQPDFTEEEENEENPNAISLEEAHVFTSFVDTLNRFRAAGSLKDSEVNEQLKIYFKLLSPGERQAIYVIFKGLIQVADLVKGNDSGKTADRPITSGINISTSSQSKKEKPSGNEDGSETKLPDQAIKNKAIQKPSKSDSTSNNPIAVSISDSVQDKSDIMKVLKEVNEA